MAELLIELLEAGLMEKLDGNDTRLGYIEKAAKSIGEVFVKEPEQLIGAILAGLDPDISPNDPSITRAKEALNAEWKTMGTVYTSPPIGLYRSILLVGCHRAAQASSNNAAIVWLTAADTFPLMHPGKEEAAVCKALENLATRTEEAAIALPKPPAGVNAQNAIKVDPPAASKSPAARVVERSALLLKITAAAGPHGRDNKQIKGANPNWSNSAATWSYDFADRMNALLADELDALGNEIVQHRIAIGKDIQTTQTAFAKAITDALTLQQSRLQEALQASEARQKAEQTRLHALWWSQALYSSSLRRSYRQLPTYLAAVVMVADLLELTPMPTPESVGYLLAETVNRLPNASFEQKRPLQSILGELRASRGNLPGDWMDRFVEVPNDGRISLRDLVVLALGNQEFDAVKAIQRAGLREDIELNLPDLAHAMFQQDQAVELARSKP